MTRKRSHGDHKRALERFDFEYFRELCSLVPRGTYSQPDPPGPDIRVPLADSFLGIELTSFSLDSALSGAGSASMARDCEKARVLEEAGEIWKAEGLPPVWVNVTWLERVVLSRQNRPVLAAALVRAAKQEIPRPGLWISAEYPFGWKELQELGVARLSVQGLNEPVELGWHSSWGGTIPSFRTGEAEIRRLLLEEEPNIQGYRDFADEVWLVIVAHGQNPESSFHFIEDDKSPKFRSSFDRAFLVSMGWREFRELLLEGRRD